jgi:LuxR family transcriptional regulator, maltose regulon positive regulatory protein
MSRLGRHLDPAPESPRRTPAPLTPREKVILRYLSSTLGNSEIAGELSVSINTVKTHQQTVYRKLGVGGRREAVRRARELRLL